jgi:hypothetical protein
VWYRLRVGAVGSYRHVQRIVIIEEGDFGPIARCSELDRFLHLEVIEELGLTPRPVIQPTIDRNRTGQAMRDRLLGRRPGRALARDRAGPKAGEETAEGQSAGIALEHGVNLPSRTPGLQGEFRASPLTIDH